MDTVATIARVVLGAVFVTAGATKIAAPRRWNAESRSMGVPHAAAAVVPWWELAVGAALVVGLAEPWPAAAAIVTLAAFTVVLASLLARGLHPVCACFGALSRAPVGPRAVARNGALIALGALALVGVR